jgi:hypothetical protein
MNFIYAAVVVALLVLAGVLIADRLSTHRRGVGLAILTDRPGDDSQFAEWRAQLREDHEGEP